MREALRLLAVFSALALLGAAEGVCAGPAEPAPAALDVPFTLVVGGIAAMSDADLQIGFDRVVADSRCPRGAQCITAGEATVLVWVSKGAGRRETRELTSDPGAPAVTFERLRLHLAGLEPYPVVPRQPKPTKYRATLRVTRLP